jgi:hypothetical protein
MNYYVEKFEVSTLFRACISKDADGFRPWINGCAISMSLKNIDMARLAIFSHIVASLLQRKEERYKELELIQSTLDKLGNDIFNLGQFKTFIKES